MAEKIKQSPKSELIRVCKSNSDESERTNAQLFDFKKIELQKLL
jgi:hypothetical protein